ncbi:MAG: hypothetical protein DMD41_16335 [Gemmatimonadetes bacterium]|nr:MAG: hypothetical protein DMD41_16335 [Gemmatimonadota bacterium]
MRHLSCVWVVAVSVTIAMGCSGGELRGKSVPSADGRTYLAIDDDNGGHCGPMKVDGREWKHEIHAPGPIEPGVHSISCGEGGEIGFEIRPRTTFHFDYWGP